MENYALLFLLVLFAILVIYLLHEYRKYEIDRHRERRNRYKNNQNLADQLVLKRSVHNINSKNLKTFVLFMIVIIALMMAMIIMSLVKDIQDITAEELVIRIAEHFRENPSQLLNLLAMIMFSIIVPVISAGIIKNEKLILSKSGIRYFPPLKKIKIFWIDVGWHILWSEIESLSLGSGPGGGRLKINTLKGKSRTLMVNAWHDPEDVTVSGEKSVFSDIGHQRRLRTDHDYAMQASPLLRFIRDVAGLQVQTKGNTGLNFDLMTNRYTRKAVIILFVMLAYVFTDLVINSETYVEDAPIILFVIAGVMVALFFVLWFINNAVPRGNALVLAMLLGAMAGLVLYPGLLRINQLTDDEGLKAYSYRHVNGPRFEPVEAAMPDIVMFEDGYWYSLPDGSEMVFWLRRGGLGFYQIDMAPIYQQTRMWYCTRGAVGDEARRKQCEKDVL